MICYICVNVVNVKGQGNEATSLLPSVARNIRACPTSRSLPLWAADGAGSSLLKEKRL